MTSFTEEQLRALPADLQQRINHQTQGLSSEERLRFAERMAGMFANMTPELRERLQTILFDDDDRDSAESTRSSVVAPSPRSQSATQKDATRRHECFQRAFRKKSRHRCPAHRERCLALAERKAT